MNVPLPLRPWHRHHLHDRADVRRIQKIAKVGEGFLYIVSSLGVTGTRTEIKTDLKEIIDTAKEVQTYRVPSVSASTRRNRPKIGRVADGVIVGSAIVKTIAKYGDDAAPHL